MASVRLEDYWEYSHKVPKTHLTFDIKSDREVEITSKMEFERNPAAQDWDGTLVLNGAPAQRADGDRGPVMMLDSNIKLNGRIIGNRKNGGEPHYVREGSELRLHNLPKTFDLEVTTKIDPSANKSNSGLFKAGNSLLTHCEPEGFRNFTFFPDRPDVLSVFTTTIIGNKEQFPTIESTASEAQKHFLLSNGDEISREVTDDRVSITYKDETPKASYLFALVTGKFDIVQDTYRTHSGRDIKLEVYADPGKKDQVTHAMSSLKEAIRFNEEKFGREYELDTYRIVATSDFPVLAMENKGLNLFNPLALYADPLTATDEQFHKVFKSTVHEFFHNDFGNRVTIKTWFDMFLKEGLATKREGEILAKKTNPDVQRINEVNILREFQFQEDASPNAQPVRPNVYEDPGSSKPITTYHKGREVFRMLETMLGKDKFEQGIKNYLERYDGKAADAEAFMGVMQEASDIDLTQFFDTWFNQAGTPSVKVTDEIYDPEKQTYTITLAQSKPNTMNYPKDDPFHIPIQMGLVASNGQDIPLKLAGQNEALANDLIHLTEREQTFTFEKIPEGFTPSFLRGYSAPVKFEYDYSRDDLITLMNHDTDPFNRWEAAQRLAVGIIKEQAEAIAKGETVEVDGRLAAAFRVIMQDDTIKNGMKAKLLALPSYSYVSNLYEPGTFDAGALKDAFTKVRQTIAGVLKDEFETLYNANIETIGRAYEWNEADVGARAVRHLALDYLVAQPESDRIYYKDYAEKEWQQNNKTDQMAGLRSMLRCNPQRGYEMLGEYYNRFRDSPLNMMSWFSIQAEMDSSQLIHIMKNLTENSAFKTIDPATGKSEYNYTRTLLFFKSFKDNPRFHDSVNGRYPGYKLLADHIIKIDKTNPKLASFLLKPFLNLTQHTGDRRQAMASQLQRISNSGMSKKLASPVKQALEEYQRQYPDEKSVAKRERSL